MKEIIKAVDLKKYYGNKNYITKAINGISLTVNEGEFISVMGASGSGKTTLLNMFSTLDIPTSGSLDINGIDVCKLKKNQMSDFRRKNLGFIFQDFNLLDTLTLRENIAFSLSINNVPYKEIEQMVNEISEKFGITDTLEKYPYEVSGGQKQRATAARAIINKPMLILADEPTGALDSKSSLILLQTISQINEENGTTVLMVTHDALAASYCKSVIFIRDGKIFTRLEKGNMEKKEYLNKILNTVSILEGGYSV
ncbi:MAG: bacitracin ABC transporter ATP-binding protein [Clostridiales bacterium]|nr:MAG: bacitracin ABC transporter ATP-binding protein [Clostridiales bacterium]